jgi:alkyl hydroperoxide reductase subunit AhpF
MSLLAPADQQKLREMFAAMTRNVRLIFVTQTFGSETSGEAQKILDELPPLSGRISIEEVNLILEPDRAKEYGFDRAPGIAVVYEDEAGAIHDSRIRFLGAPSGYEFISLVQAVLLAGGGGSNLSDETRAKLAALDRPAVMQVFTTPT